MKYFLAIITIACLVVFVPARQQNQSPAPKLIQFYLAILKRNPNWTMPSSKEVVSLHDDHVAYVQSLLKSGKAVIAGAIQDDQQLAGVYIFRTANAEEAKSWAMSDPAVVAGHLFAELHPWWAEDVMRKTETPQKMTTAYLAFLTRGEKWTAQSTPETEEIQKNHLANIRRLAEMKKLVVAGPFGDDGNLRGIFVFRVASLAEAQQLAETDPAVRAGLLKLDIHPWVVPDGILP